MEMEIKEEELKAELRKLKDNIILGDIYLDPVSGELIVPEGVNIPATLIPILGPQLQRASDKRVAEQKLKWEEEKLKQEKEFAEIEAGLARFDKNFANSQRLREHFVKESGLFKVVAEQYERIKNLYAGPDGKPDLSDPPIGSPTKAGNDLSLIYTFIKMMDAQTGVRTGEIELSKELLSLYDRAKMLVEKPGRGAILQRGAREAMYNALDPIYRAALKNATPEGGLATVI